MVKFIFDTSLILILYTWAGYYLILNILARYFSKPYEYPIADNKPFVSILIAAYNEAEVIESRILNLLSMDYDHKKMEILIGSDGSMDATAAISRKFANQGVRVFDFQVNRGRADVHNDLVRQAQGEILVFTDADTVFDSSFLFHIIRPFSQADIGAVVGNLSYQIKGGEVAEHEALYWRYEQKLKQLENRLQLVNNGTGACMAMRKKLFQTLTPVDDIDSASVVDIVKQGYKIVFMPEAKAFDIPPHRPQSEFRMRVRGTSKTGRSLYGRITAKAILQNPAFFWSLFSHRLGRYLTPFLMITLLLTNLMLFDSGSIYKLFLYFQFTFYFLTLVGYLSNVLGKSIFIANSCFIFTTAMAGIFVGVVKALSGKVKVTYKTDDSL